jgi:hypothetical protein
VIASRTRPRLLWAAVFGFGLIGGLIFGPYLIHRIEVLHLENRFSKIELGMPESAVESLMNRPGRVYEPKGPVWWNDRLVEAESSRVAKEVWYSPPFWLFPISFAVAYDRHGNVIGKHRYD